MVLFGGTLALVVQLSRAASIVTAKDEVIATRAAPAIVSLQAMRRDVQQEHALRDGLVLGLSWAPAVNARLDQLQGDMARNREVYLALPAQPGEEPLRRELVSSLDYFESLVWRARALTPDSEASRSDILRELDRAVGDVGNALARASDFDADVASAAAGQALGVSRKALPSAVVLGVMTATAAVGTIALTFWAARRADRVAEETRRALERKADELEAFAGRVAHDLASPLMTVALYLDVAQRPAYREDPRASSGLVRAAATLHRVRGFISDLLEFARAGARPLPGVHTRVGEVVRDVMGECEPIARDGGVDLRAEAVPDRDVRCSPGVLTSLVSNLVHNAIKFLAASDVRRVVVGAVDLGKEIRVEVEDTGPGIPATERERIFEPFARGPAATTSVPGLGMGLATVRRLAEAHGGHAGVRSEAGRGSVFWFTLPYWT